MSLLGRSKSGCYNPLTVSELTPLQKAVTPPAPRLPQRPPAEKDAPLPSDGFTATTLSAPPQRLLPAPPPAPEAPAVAPAPPPTETSYGLVSTEVPVTLPIEVAPAAERTAPSPQKLAYDALCDGSHSPTKNLGPGFPSAPGPETTVATKLHDMIAGTVPGIYSTGSDLLLSKISDATEKGAGLHVKDLLQVERTLYQALSHSQDGFVGGAAPLFQALAEGKAAYVELGKELANEADHLMRLYAGIPLDVIEATGHGNDHLKDVRRILLERAKKQDFPVYVDVDGNYTNVTPTESIAGESIASIARRENSLGDDFPDPRQYYKWLVTRVESSYRRLDPWLYAVSPEQHHVIGEIKDGLAPPWLRGKDKTPLGSRPHPENVQKSYEKFMKLCGDGAPPTMQNLADIADLAVQMDRDLISGIQSFWIKLLSEVSPEQRKTLMEPLARTWVTLNALPNGDAQFDMVSPPNAPYIELIDKNTGKVKLERYDRAMAASETIDHTLDGLGIQERKAFICDLMKEIRGRKDAFLAREERLRVLLGSEYRGLDIEGILSGRVNGDDPEVKGALADLKKALNPTSDFHPMTPERAEIMRHRDMLGWVANKSRTYGDVGFDLMNSLTGVGFDKDPLIVGEFYTGSIGPVTELPPGPSQSLVLGPEVPGQQPIKMSQVFEGGGGKGNAYVEALTQFQEILSKGPGQVAIDEFVGNSAGAITAFFLAAGFTPEETKEKQKQIEFNRFYSDYLWLSGGVDPKVRGIDRTGLFSTQKMYKTLSEILSEKVGVTGRPVLFRDLPFKLKVTATVLNTDMPQELKDKLGIDKDGQIVFSSENTPNMDVVAAVCASSSVPGFFNAPQVQLAQKMTDNGKPVLHRLQLVDGGVVNNYPISEASRDPNGKGMLIQVPVSFQAPNPEGGDPISLSTLEFQPQNLKLIDDFNRERIRETAGNLGTLIDGARKQGCERVVMGFNLGTMDSQTQPAVLGENKGATKRYVKLAQDAGVDSLSAGDSRAAVEGNQKSDTSSHVLQMLADWLLDKDGTFKHKFFGDPEYNPRSHEAHGMSDMISGVAAASLVAPYLHPQRRFENREA